MSEKSTKKRIAVKFILSILFLAFLGVDLYMAIFAFSDALIYGNINLEPMALLPIIGIISLTFFVLSLTKIKHKKSMLF
ncbi:MAG: hypothetical protein KBT46_00485 [Ruminococcus sp.]|nr:hypothetical protein [Candidatus Copronaster equi]